MNEKEQLGALSDKELLGSYAHNAMHVGSDYSTYADEDKNQAQKLSDEILRRMAST